MKWVDRGCDGEVCLWMERRIQSLEALICEELRRSDNFDDAKRLMPSPDRKSAPRVKEMRRRSNSPYMEDEDFEERTSTFAVNYYYNLLSYLSTCYQSTSTRTLRKSKSSFT